MAAKFLHDDHTLRLASRVRRLRKTSVSRDGAGSALQTALRHRTVHRHATIQEKWMTFTKTTVLALAVSAALASPVLAQGAASDTQLRGGAQGRGAVQGGGMSGSGDEELEAQPTAPAQKGVNAKAGNKGTVGSGHATPKATGSESAPATKKY